MGITVQARGRVAELDYAVVGRGTLCIRSDRDRLAQGSFRNLLLRLDEEQRRLSLTVVQAAFHLPNLTSFNHPLDIAGAAISYARRHPELRAVHVVAPQRGLVSLVIDAAARAMPGFETRFLSDPVEAVPLLRLREPDLPTAWHELPLG